MAVLFPTYKDEKSRAQKTNQKIVVHNDTKTAPGGMKGGISHNTNWGGSGQAGDNVTISPGDTKEITNLVPNFEIAGGVLSAASIPG